MKERLTIVKVGGKIVESEDSLAQLLRDFEAVEGHKILVHGGGRTATDVAAKLGIETKMIDGRRVTDAEMLRVVTMVYAGLVNKNVVARLQACGVNALGLTGADMDVIRSHKRRGTAVDYGFVGDVDVVDGARLSQLVRSGITPVLAPLTHDGEGSMLNTNADTVAGETAKALAGYFDVTLMYCFEHAGVLSDPEDADSVIRHIDKKSFRELIDAGVVSGGMIPKIENALAAVDAGVCRVVITKADALKPDAGTEISL